MILLHWDQALRHAALGGLGVRAYALWDDKKKQELPLFLMTVKVSFVLCTLQVTSILWSYRGEWVWPGEVWLY